MAIDKTGEYWHGDSKEDIIEFLNEYTDNEVEKIALVECSQCKSDVFTFKYDDDEGGIEVTCAKCKKKKLLLDSEEYWEDCEPEQAECSLCQNKKFNVAVGFIYRKEESEKVVKWVYIGNRCTKCGVLGSFLDWKIDYAPTDEMEKNV
jgi:hypothetical protein